jgi:hypothetical protein
MGDWFEPPILEHRRSRAGIWCERIAALMTGASGVLIAYALGDADSAGFAGIYMFVAVAIVCFAHGGHRDWAVRIMHQKASPAQVFPKYFQSAKHTPEMVRLVGWVMLSLPYFLFTLLLIGRW